MVYAGCSFSPACHFGQIIQYRVLPGLLNTSIHPASIFFHYCRWGVTFFIYFFICNNCSSNRCFLISVWGLGVCRLGLFSRFCSCFFFYRSRCTFWFSASVSMLQTTYPILSVSPSCARFLWHLPPAFNLFKSSFHFPVLQSLHPWLAQSPSFSATSPNVTSP